MVKSWLYSCLLVLISGYLIVNASGKVWQLWQAQKALDDAQRQLAGVYLEQQELERALAQQQTDAYVEFQARERLNLVRPDETVLLMPKDTPVVVGYEAEKSEQERSNWELWVDRFLGQ